MKWLLVGSFLVFSGSSQADFLGLFGYDNFHECILDNLPGVESHKKARRIYKKCKKDYPLKKDFEKQQPFFGIQSAEECLDEYGQDYSQADIYQIRASCKKLYF